MLSRRKREEIFDGGEDDLLDHSDDKDDDIITMDELSAAVRKMKNGKSPGCDGIMVELIKERGQQLEKEILRELNVK